MKASRFSALFLCLAILLSLAACGQARPEAPDTAEPVEQTSEPIVEPAAEEVLALDAELQRAYDAGLLPEAWLEDMEATATFAEYAKILARAVELWNKVTVPEFEGHMRLAAEADEPMNIEDGYLMLSYVWVLMGRSETWPDDFMRNAWTLASQETMDELGHELRWNYPLFPDVQEIVYPYRNSDYLWGAVMDFPSVMSPVSGEYMFPYDAENNSLYLNRPLSRDMAVRALLRMLEYCRVELDQNWRDYVALADAGTYDRSIITGELLNAPSELPEVTQAKLPSEWRGAGISARKGVAADYVHFSESDVRFLAENGFNFTRLFFGFETLRYPDYPDDPRMVNKYELRELDQLLAWCLKYDVHLQIAMNSYLGIDGTAYIQSDMIMPQSDAEWALTRDYWEMLAKRYAGIPSKYLTFDLCNEVQPHHDSTFLRWSADHLQTLISSVKTADPSRVLLYSFPGNPNIDWVDAIGKLGLAIGCHPYKPDSASPNYDGNGPLPAAPFEIRDSGLYAMEEGVIVDEDYIYRVGVAPYREIAEKYGVGFMCNEFGIFTVMADWNVDLVVAYHEICVRMMEKYDLGWCFCEEFNRFPKHLRILYGDESQWTGATVEEVTYTYDDGRTETVKYCKELVDQLRAHTMK